MLKHKFFITKSFENKRSHFEMFINGKNPINVAKGWKGNAISKQKKIDPNQATMNIKTAQSIIDAHKKTIKANNIMYPYNNSFFINQTANIYWLNYFQPRLFSLSAINPFAVQRFIEQNWK